MPFLGVIEMFQPSSGSVIHGRHQVAKSLIASNHLCSAVDADLHCHLSYQYPRTLCMNLSSIVPRKSFSMQSNGLPCGNQMNTSEYDEAEHQVQPSVLFHRAPPGTY